MSATMTSSGHSTALSRSEVHRHRTRRRLSTPNPRQPTRLQNCPPLPYSLEALDLSSASPTQTLASLRVLILSYLADLERKLCQLESPDLEAWKAMGEMTIEEARQWARTAREMLKGIRADVCSHFPEFHFSDISLENFIRSHFPDLSDVTGLTEMRSRLPGMPDVRSRLPDVPHLLDMPDMRSHLPDMPHLLDMPDVRSRFPDIPHLPDMPDVRSHLSDMRTKLDGVRSRFHDIDFKNPLSYIPALSDRLKNLHSHLSSMELPSGLDSPAFTPSSIISDLLDMLSSEVITELLGTRPDLDGGEDLLERTAIEVTNAVKRSLEGVRLIKYCDLPHQWRNNPFVVQGYRLVFSVALLIYSDYLC